MGRGLVFPAILAGTILLVGPGCGGGDGEDDPVLPDWGTPSDPGVDSTEPDIPGLDHTGTDIPGTDAPGAEIKDEDPGDPGPGCPGGPGCSCAKDDDCDIPLCVDNLEGYECVTPCIEDEYCRQGWKCTQFDLPGGDVLYGCKAPFVLCRPCITDDDCQWEGWGTSLCIEAGSNGRYCGSPCQKDDDCPHGYGCGDGATAGQCLKDTSCQCNAKFVAAGYTTLCYTENQFGKCEAEVACFEPCPAPEAALETCDDLDNDCDGADDEDWPTKLQPCDGPDPDGCESGQMKCTADGLGVECVGDTPHPEECNGVDDNCNGETDEGFDPGVPCDGDDGDLCENGTTTCTGDGTGVECVNEAPKDVVEACNGDDDDCDGDTDEEDAEGCEDYWKDFDGDGYGEPGDMKCLCAPQGDFKVTNDGDCDDLQEGANPGQVEDCDTDFDDDCNGLTNEQDAQDCSDFHWDEDDDGYGTDDFQCWCGPVGTWRALVPGDCADGDFTVNPGASLCGGDADCDGLPLDAGEDCDDGNNVPWDGCWNCLASESLVNTWTTLLQRHPSIATASDGRFVVAWEGQGASGEAKGDIYARRYPAAGPAVEQPFMVNGASTFLQEWPSVALHGNGAFEVVWQQWLPDGSEDSVYGRRFDADGAALGGEYGASQGYDSQHGEVAVLTTGGYVVVWEASSDIEAQRYKADGGKDGASFDVSPGNLLDLWHPSVSGLDQGRFVVTWQSLHQDGGSWGVYARRYQADGAADGTEFLVNTHTADDQTAPVVSGTPDGKHVIVWASQIQDGHGNGVFGQRYDASGNPDGAEFQANTWTSSNQYQPRVARFDDGRFVVLWTSFGQDGSLWGVYGQRYGTGGSPDGGEFQVNTYTDHAQEYPQVATLPDGGFVVAWESHGQDGDNRGIFVQRFSADGAKGY